MLDLITRMGDIIDRKDRISFLFFFIGIFLNSLLEIVGIGLILPFIALLGHPSLLTTNGVLSRMYQALHFHSFKQCMITLAGMIIIIFIFKNVFLFILSFFQARFIYRKQADISIRLFRAYLMCPYSFHLRKNLINLRHALGEVQLTMGGVLLPLLNLITEIIMVGFLFLLLFWKYPLLTFGIMVILGVPLFCYFQMMRKKLRQWGEATGRHMLMTEQQICQGMGSIKESKLWGKEMFFLERFSFNCKSFSGYQSRNEVIGKSPRLFIESIVVGLMMLAMIVYFMLGTPTEKIFTMLSLFAIVAIRLMPGLNRISASWSSIKFHKPFFDRIHQDLMDCEEMERTVRQKRPQGIPLGFNKSIELKNVIFAYEATTVPALQDISLIIQKNTTVGFVGPSGAGKSTAIDVILGLLDPSSGSVLVDGRDINENIRSWQQRIGYIPQAIYLSDDTIRNNVAFALEPDEISEDKVWTAIHLAQLEDFVRSLPEGLDTVIGERGIRLSGGQKQRIGIARALYNDPEILVMDEATAALDNETERDFMEALAGLSGGKTILIIAHRLTTVRCCDTIFFLKAGRLVDCGTYQELSGNCPDFSRMAGVGHF